MQSYGKSYIVFPLFVFGTAQMKGSRYTYFYLKIFSLSFFTTIHHLFAYYSNIRIVNLYSHGFVYILNLRRPYCCCFIESLFIQIYPFHPLLFIPSSVSIFLSGIIFLPKELPVLFFLSVDNLPMKTLIFKFFYFS